MRFSREGVVFSFIAFMSVFLKLSLLRSRCPPGGSGTVFCQLFAGSALKVCPTLMLTPQKRKSLRKLLGVLERRGYSFTLRKRSALTMTDTELKLIATSAMTGLRSRPKNG